MTTQTEVLTQEEIDDAVCDILYRDGPDQHVDGHDVITSFIIAALVGEGRQWIKNYEEKA